VVPFGVDCGLNRRRRETCAVFGWRGNGASPGGRAGFGRRPAWGGDAAATRPRSSSGRTWLPSLCSGDGGRGDRGSKSTAAWRLGCSSAAAVPIGPDLGLTGPDLGLIGTAVASGRHSPSVMEGSSPPLGCRAARCLQACVTYPVLLVGCAMWHLSELWLESVDAGTAALEGGLHRRLSGERRGGGDGSFIWPCGWRGKDVGGLCCWRCFGSGSPGSCVGGLPWRQRAWTEDGEQHKGFSEQKLSASAPSATMPASIVTLLGAPMRLPSPR
jgi:hypothetical protein